MKMELTNKLEESLLVLPMSGYEMDCAEMSYVSGGEIVYTEYTDWTGIIQTAFSLGSNVIGIISSSVKAAASTATVIGTVIGVLSAIWSAYQAVTNILTLIGCLKGYQMNGRYTIEEHKVFGLTYYKTGY